MSTNSSGAAVARNDRPVAQSFPQVPAIPPRDLAELAAAVDRLEALLAAAAGFETVGSDAIERIADIAFVLHERDVEASLCDALDAAVRDLGDADARAQANVERIRQAAELLRELSRRVNGIIARSLAAPPSAGESTAGLYTVEPASAGEEAGEAAFVEEVVDGGLNAGAQAIATLAEPLLRLADRAATASASPHELAADVATERPENCAVARGDVDSNHEVHSRGEAARQDRLHAVSPTTTAAKVCAQGEAALRREWQTLADPEDDPGDLFEPSDTPVATAGEVSASAVPQSPAAPPPNVLANVEPTSTPADDNAAAAAQAMPQASHITGPDGLSEISAPPTPPAPASPSPTPPRLTADAPQQAIGPQTPNDPLAAVRALSEEETIALFS